MGCRSSSLALLDFCFFLPSFLGCCCCCWTWAFFCTTSTTGTGSGTTSTGSTTCKTQNEAILKSICHDLKLQFVLEDLFIQSSTQSFILLWNFQDDSDKCLDVNLQTFLTNFWSNWWWNSTWCNCCDLNCYVNNKISFVFSKRAKSLQKMPN